MFEIARNQEFALSAQLEKSTQKIWKLSDDLNSNAFGIAYHIADVATTGAYEQDYIEQMRINGCYNITATVISWG